MKLRHFVSDPVLCRTDFRCGYCGCDLLADLDSFLTIVRDHLVPRSAGGPDAAENRVAACPACDRLKANAVVRDVATARLLVAGRRAWHREWFDNIRAAVRA